MMGDSDSGDAQFDWDRILDATPHDLSSFFDVVIDPSLPPTLGCDSSNPSPGSFTLTVDEIEVLLMKDDDDGIVTANIDDVSDGFLSDLLLDLPSPIDGDGSREVVDVSDRKSSNADEGEEVQENEDGKNCCVQQIKDTDESTDADAEDPVSKKRKRQLRNRDAAVRSRERKKMYVKDLEMKSRYYEGECKRLGMLLQCFLAENQALRLSLQNSKAGNASMTKQESAVLLLESLLLGSLLWFMGIVCLLVLPSQARAGPTVVRLKIMQNEKHQSLAPREVGSKVRPLSFFLGKRCSASRSRMKPFFLAPQVLAFC